jgi:glycosyltransferase involved in cell wall biosynthesis
MPSPDTPQHPELATGISQAQDNLPWLSVLIPAYEYALGVDRILSSLAAQMPVGVECIVRDDSGSNEVQNVVEGWILREEVPCLTYMRSPKSEGAVDNWNSLLAIAKGEYVLLMHHDEAPLGPDFFALLQQELYADGGTDVLILGCMIGQESSVHLRRHMPAVLQSYLLNVMGPTYLLRHNFIGPPSVLVIRKSACPPFDARLKWLVDVDWMYRAINPILMRCRISNVLRVASLERASASITSTLKGKLKEIERRELTQICTEQDVGRLSILLQPSSWQGKCLSTLDSTMWFAVKITMRLLFLWSPMPNPFRLSRSDS